MSGVKEELDHEAPVTDDSWLLEWSNPEEEVKKELEDKKSVLKCGLDDSKKETCDPEKLVNFKGTYKDKLTEALKNAPISNTVSNLCEFQCPKCEKVYNDRQTFGRHLKEKRHFSKENDILNNYLITVVGYRCLICSKIVLCDIIMIRCHIRHHHKISSLQQYPSAEANVPYFNSTSNREMVKRELNSFCLKHACEKNITTQIGNMCTFSCKQCNYTTQSYAKLRLHITSRKHGPFLPSFRYVSAVKFHKCHVCEELVLSDYSILAHHVVNKHKLTLTKYRKLINLSKHDNPQQTQYQIELQLLIKDIPSLKPRPTYTLKANALSDGQVTKDVGNITSFKCPECYFSCVSFLGFTRHIKKEHKLKKISYIKHIVEARYHRCHICAKIVLCDNIIVGRHVITKHQVNLLHYQKEYVLKTGNRVLPTFTDYQVNSQIFESFKNKNSQPEDAKKSDDGMIMPSMISSESEDSDDDF